MRTKKSGTGKTGQRLRLTSFSCPCFRMSWARLTYHMQKTTELFSGKMKWPMRNATREWYLGDSIVNTSCYAITLLWSPLINRPHLCTEIFYQFFSVSLFNMIRQLRKVSTLRANKQQKDKKFKMIIINILRHLREKFVAMK